MRARRAKLFMTAIVTFLIIYLFIYQEGPPSKLDAVVGSIDMRKGRGIIIIISTCLCAATSPWLA
jgi:hypothetical protein